MNTNIFIRSLKKAQVTVELLLVLPIFFLMIFFIMEIGLLAHRVIVVNHAAYELARIGSLLSGPKGGESSSYTKNVDSQLQVVLCQMFQNCGNVQMITSVEYTGADPQTGGSHQNDDFVVTLVYPVRLAFPGPNYFLADSPKSAHIKRINVTVRMPIEKPFFKSSSI